MDQGISPRVALAGIVVALGAGIVWLLGGSIDGALVALVAGVAVIALLAGANGQATPDPVATPDNGRQHDDATQAVIDAIDDPILVVAGSRIACANPVADELFGRHVVGEDARVAIRHPAAAERLLATGEADGEPVALVGIGSREQRWEMRIAPLPGGRRLVRLSDRTGAHVAERMRVDFVANASHELRTPLASLLGFIETLQDEAGEDPATRARFLKVMFDEARRMQRLIDDLISLSRIEADKFREPADIVDLAALARETADALRATHGARGGELILDCRATPAVRGDRAQLSQLMFNIFGNAMKYGRHGTPVTVTLITDDAMTRLSVVDEGEGIAPEHLPRLTERFYRVDSGRSRALGGTGLGLAIVKHIVERHRGRLDIESVHGEGTTVTVTLPLGDVIKP